jgi:hypothetical protein
MSAAPMSDPTANGDEPGVPVPAHGPLTCEEHAQKLTLIAQAVARCIGLDLTLTPLPKIRITLSGTPPTELECIGVRIEGVGAYYAVIRLPHTGGYRALKCSPTGEVVLRLRSNGASFRNTLSCVCSSIIWDRLRDNRPQYEPQLALFPAPTALHLTSDLNPPTYPSRPKPKPPKPQPSPSPLVPAPDPVSQSKPSQEKPQPSKEVSPPRGGDTGKDPLPQSKPAAVALAPQPGPLARRLAR